jgi:peptidoglycan/LPS O-acetylase OafA/YrhL
VSFFFVLSGFLITYLMLEEIDSHGKLDVAAFYVRRILRIWPLYYAVLLWCFVVYPLVKLVVNLPPTVQSGSPVWYLLFLSNFDVLRFAGLEGALSTNVTWSVAIEEQFYLTWPLVLRTLPTRSYRAVFLTLIGGALAFRLANAHTHAVLYFHTFSVISDMVIGGLAAQFWRTSPNLRAGVQNMPRAVVLLGYCSGFLLIGGASLWGGSYLGPFERMGTAVFFAFVVLEQNYCAHSVVKMSVLPLVTTLGRYTYGLYLLHAIVITLLARGLLVAGADPGGIVHWLVLGPVGLLASIGLAAFSYHSFERPFLALKSRFAHVASGVA